MFVEMACTKGTQKKRSKARRVPKMRLFLEFKDIKGMAEERINLLDCITPLNDPDVKYGANNYMFGEKITLEPGKMVLTEGGKKTPIPLEDSNGKKFENISEMNDKEFQDFLSSVPPEFQNAIIEGRDAKTNPRSIASPEDQVKAFKKTIELPAEQHGAMKPNLELVVAEGPPVDMAEADKPGWWERKFNAAIEMARAIGRSCIDLANKLYEAAKENKKMIFDIGKIFLIKYLTEQALNSMLAASNGCWLVDAATGSQVYQINNSTDGKMCTCDGTKTADSRPVYDQCRTHCALVPNHAQTYAGCVDMSCNCTNSVTGDLTHQNYSVKIINNNCYTMFAQVLSTTGLMISDFVGTVADGVYNIASGIGSAFSSWYYALIAIGVVLVIVGCYYVYRAFKNKKLAAQGNASTTVVLASPSAAPPFTASTLTAPPLGGPPMGNNSAVFNQQASL
jgi:hypothetical protein